MRCRHAGSKRSCLAKEWAERPTIGMALAGHIDPIDGRYHWQGTVFDELPVDAKLPKQITVTVGDHHAKARIVERPPQGGYSVAGVGAPPFALDDLAVDVR
jgi:hypothetical protein